VWRGGRLVGQLPASNYIRTLERLAKTPKDDEEKA
jgi:hypothetical protein